MQAYRETRAEVVTASTFPNLRTSASGLVAKDTVGIITCTICTATCIATMKGRSLVVGRCLLVLVALWESGLLAL